ncbi:flagellar hook-associated protein FlgK [Polymorphobacter sp.]|uniref:flagellar hook-associated protein FlgK n=1 Tax=Polymorphobacter sp. TaxID=1909290 RepID=UPI003F71ABB6
MTDILTIGISGVRAYQAALSATGDNVANADTPGFSRRSVTLVAGPAGKGSILQRVPIAGDGVTATAMVRAGDALKTSSARVAAGDHARLAARADWLGRLQTSLTGAGLDARLSGFFDAATDLASAPTSTAARAIFLDRADQAAASIRTLGASLTTLATDLDTAIAATGEEINALTSALARVNEELRRTGAGSAPSLGLLDERDSLLADLAARIRISVTEGERGAVTIRLGTGAAAPLLVPAFGAAVRVGARNGPSGAELILDPTHRAETVRLPASGSLAGLLEASRDVAAQRTSLDTLATRFAADVNAWHQQGTDATGAPGQPLFTTETLAVTPGLANAGTAAIDFTLADGATLAPAGYRLIAEATGFTLARLDGTASVTNASLTDPTPLVLDGITLRPGAGARPGDQWTLAIEAGAEGLSLRPLTPDRVAVAARFTTDADVLNLGDARLTVEIDPAAAAFAAPPPLSLIISAPGVVDIIDPATDALVTSLSFVPGERLEGDGFAFSLSAGAQVGDRFRLLPTGAGSTDNRNMLALANVRARTGPSGTLEASHDAAVATLGTRLAETERLADATLAVANDAARATDAVSGVDLDREAAELTRLQLAYRANAQVIAAARDLFDTILGVAG